MISVRGRVHPAALPIYALLLGSLVSSIGNQITALAVPWFVLETTGSASKTGITAAITLVPMVLSTFFGGAIVDRMQQKQLAIAADLLSGVTVAAVPLLYHTVGLDFATLLLLMFFGAIFDSPGQTARLAMTPALAQMANLPLERVNAWGGTITAATSLAGAPLAGLLIALFGAANVLWFDAGTFLVSALLVGAFVPLAARAAPTGATLLADMREGIAFFMEHRSLRAIALTATIVNFAFSPLLGVVIPYLANTVYRSATQLGLMMGAFGLGGLLGSIIYGSLGSRWSPRITIIVTVAAFSLPVWVMASEPHIGITLVLMFVVGLGTGWVNPMVTTIIQQRTPARLLGRAMGMLSSTAMVAAPVGMFLGGLAIGALGLTGAILAIAALLTIILVSVIVNPAFRELDHSARSAALQNAAGD